MSTINVLFELGTEELPAHAVKNFPQQLQQLLSTALDNQSLTYKNIHIYITPRRIAVFINSLLAQQPDRSVEKQGPQEKAAFNDKGEPTQAGLGFARSCNIDAAELKNYIENGRLLYRFTQKGTSAQQLLPEIFTTSINNLQSGRTMRWGSNTHAFVRPVHWVVLLANDKVLEAELFGFKTQNYTYGHRFLAPGKITIKHADHYIKQLEDEGKVLVDQQARREKIITQLQKLPKQYQGQAVIDENLLDEVNGLIEWPVALIGKFSADFLQVPAEALISSMKMHQKSFPIVNDKQELMPYFITISNIESKNPQQVIHGNERVMHARLSDAAFFFNTDKQQALAQRLPALSSIMFQEKLGSLYDKTQRVVTLNERLAEALQLDMHDCVRAAWLSLCDLTTSMVQEFPELQGIMGSHYATHDGEPNAVSVALAEQYLPRFSGDTLPDSIIGCALAIAQRLDTLTGQFAAGNKPTGDKDPFALRRQAQGLMRILVEKQIDLDLPAWIELTLSLMPVKPANPKEIAGDLWKFCLERLRAWYQERGGNTDIFNAAAALNPTSPYDFSLRVQALEKFRHLPAAAALIAAHKRVKNILTKAENVEGLTVDKNLLKEQAELQLAEVLNNQTALFQRLTQQRDYGTLLTTLAELRPHIDLFFDKVMVMVDDSALRENRLALLAQLRQYLECVADISELAGMAST
jgi:glycyl-tRNA synthetase beta chain